MLTAGASIGMLSRLGGQLRVFHTQAEPSTLDAHVKTAKVTINGKEVVVPEGVEILQACRALGVQASAWLARLACLEGRGVMVVECGSPGF